MEKRAQYWVLAGILTVIVGALTQWPVNEQRRPRVASEAPEPSLLERAYPANAERFPAAPAPEAPAERDAEIAAILSAWRDGVIQKDADTVIRLDMTFQERPERYVAALVASSQKESNERVRAFSTRELGKFRRPELARHFHRLLSDSSPFVRQNAAWALGELAGAPDGLEAARATLADLRRAHAKDPDSAVRTAARGALDKIE